jgi:hypothetical protein
MIEYPSIMHSSKAPRKDCIAFDKKDGSNIRVKYSHKKGFHLFGSRRQLIDESHQNLGKVIPYFNDNIAEPVEQVLRKHFKDAKEIITFGEWVGDSSFAGLHDQADPTLRFILFDVLFFRKNIGEFVNPREFVKLFDPVVEIPRVIYEGNLNDSFIQNVREDKFNTFEGVICKGTEKVGNAVGKTWMCKIKTQRYLDSLKDRFGNEWEKYAE